MIDDLTLIGLCGRAHTGKDTAADYLCAAYGFERASFAEAMKMMLEAKFAHVGIDHAYLHEPQLKNEPIPGLGVSARHLMQTLGTEWGRGLVSPDLWVRLLDMHLGISAGQPVHDRMVITDVRFPNEADWLHQAGGRLLRLMRAQAPGVRAHESERHADTLPADTTVDNNGLTPFSLHARLDAEMAELGVDERPPLHAWYAA
jgi:hypothetical protein